MSTHYDLRQIKRRTFQLMAFEDGLWDLLMGFIFMFLAIYPVTRERLGPEWNLALFLSLLVLVIVAHLVARQLVSQPRIGYAQARQTPKVRIIIAITVVIVLITIGLVALTFFSPVPASSSEASAGRSYMVELITLLFLGGLFSAFGYLFGVARLYFYGWMVGLAYLLSVYMVHNAGWTFLIPLAVVAGIILLIGFARLARFLQKYPARVGES